MDCNEEKSIMDEQIKLIISTLNSTIGKLENTVSDLNKTVQKVEISNNENSLLIKTLSNNVDTLTSRVERHSDKITALENKPDKSKANLVDKIGWIIIAAATSGLIAMVVKSLHIGVAAWHVYGKD